MLLFTCLPNSAAAEKNQRETPTVKAIRAAGPAVVNISTEYETRRSSPFSGMHRDPFFDSFFRDFFERDHERQSRRMNLGSGVIIDGKRGLILTNSHVISKTGKITVTLRDEREFEAAIVGADPDSDLAVLRINADRELPDIKMGHSDDLMIGETVIAIGNPFGFSHTVTTGVISAVKRSIKTDDGKIFKNFIQTDASINPGNSGGPLLNINGELIGINTAIYAKAQGIGFAIPIDNARRIISDLIRYGEVVDAWIGLVVQDIDAGLAGYLKLTGKKGVLVKKVENNSPAYTAGIREGDIVLSLNSNGIASTAEFRSAAKRFTSQDQITAEVLRNGLKMSFTMTASVFPLDQADQLSFRILGINVENIPANRQVFSGRGSEGVMIYRIDSSSQLAGVGARVGDIIRQVNEDRITDKQSYDKTIIKHRQKDSVVLLLQRGAQGYYITVKLR